MGRYTKLKYVKQNVFLSLKLNVKSFMFPKFNCDFINFDNLICNFKLNFPFYNKNVATEIARSIKSVLNSLTLITIPLNSTEYFYCTI